MNYNESISFVNSNTPERIAEKLTQLSTEILKLKSEIKGDDYWVKVYVGQLLSNPEAINQNRNDTIAEAKRFVELLKGEI